MNTKKNDLEAVEFGLRNLRRNGYSRTQLKELVDKVCNEEGRGKKSRTFP